jgi:4a-hydroxytetrahydrobiopterin dehydratase
MNSSHLLDDETLSRSMAELPLWRLSKNDKDSTYLSRNFTAKNFQCALDAINDMGKIAERESHHPDFHLTNYRDVDIQLYTHKLGGITENDLQLAKMLDQEVKISYSPKWLKAHPEAQSSTKE